MTLDITLSDRLVDLVEEGYDLAIRIAALETSSLVSRRLATTRMTLCTSPEYLRRHGTPRHPSELGGHQLIAYSYLATKDDWHFHGPEGRGVVSTRPWMRTNNGETCRAAALAHQGVILQPRFVVDAELAAGHLVELLPDYHSTEIGIYAVYPSRKHLSAKVRVLVEFLADRLARHRVAA